MFSTGEVKLDDGEKGGEIVIEIPQLPLSNTEETVTVVLEQPYGVPAKLGKNNSCEMSITHDKGYYTLYQNFFDDCS